MTTWRFVKAPCQLGDTPDAGAGICSACRGVAFSRQPSPCIHHQYCDHLFPCAVPFSNHRPYVLSHRRRSPSPFAHAAPIDLLAWNEVDSLYTRGLWKRKRENTVSKQIAGNGRTSSWRKSNITLIIKRHVRIYPSISSPVRLVAASITFFFRLSRNYYDRGSTTL